MSPSHLQIGVLALQGGFHEHLDLLKTAAKTTLPSDLAFSAILVRSPEQLETCDALILPGGESTTMTLLANKGRLMDPLRQMIERRQPIWGTCAGMIMLADEVEGGALSDDPSGKAIGGFPIRVCRNQYGRQTESFEHPLHIEGLRNPSEPFPAIFIRAPITHSRLSSSKNSSEPIEILAEVPESALPSSKQPPGQAATTRQTVSLGPDAKMVALKKGNLLVSSFHPELTTDPRVHELWLTSCVLPYLGSREQRE